MKRQVAAVLLLLLGSAVWAQARLVKELEITTSCKVSLKSSGQTSWYVLSTQNDKAYVLGDREFFGPATRDALDEAAKRGLIVDVTGHLLIYNDQEPAFALPLRKMEIKGLSTAQPEDQNQAQAQPQAEPDPEPFKSAKLKIYKSMTLDAALNGYAFFTSRSWKVITPGQQAEFRGELNLRDYTDQDSDLIDRLKTKSLQGSMRSITFVAPITLSEPGLAESPEPYLEAEMLDGTKDRLVWKNPPGYYWDRIYKQRKIKVDYFISKLVANPNYGLGRGADAQ